MLRCFTFLVLMLTCPVVLAADAPVFPPPPRLATTAAELAKQKAGPDFAALRDQAVKAADALLREPPALHPHLPTEPARP